MANNAVIHPKEGYLRFLKDLCEKNHIVLIFNEVKTGFRVAKGGAQQLFGVKSHLSTFAKALGNGYPISAVVGLKDIMQNYANNNVILYQVPMQEILYRLRTARRKTRSNKKRICTKILKRWAMPS